MSDDELHPPPAERPAGYYGTWPPVCDRCGHRHAGPPCAGHVWDDPCDYDAGANCDATGLRPLPPYRPPRPSVPVEVCCCGTPRQPHPRGGGRCRR